MRVLLKAEWSVEKGNELIRSGNLPAKIKSILDDLKPEAAYFVASHGRRCALLFLDIADPSQLPAIAEPWFQMADADIEVTPAMKPEDLMKAAPAIEKAVKKYA